MASALYAKGKEKFLSGGIDLMTDTIKVAFVDAADYTPDLAAHEFHSDLPGAGIISSGTVVVNSVALGVVNADDTILPAVSGDQFEYLVLYKDTGSSATSPLIALIDTAGGLPYSPIGSQIIITWDNGPYKVFAI